VSENHVSITNKFWKSGMKFKDFPKFPQSSKFDFFSEGQNALDFCPILSLNRKTISHFLTDLSKIS